MQAYCSNMQFFWEFICKMQRKMGYTFKQS